MNILRRYFTKANQQDERLRLAVSNAMVQLFRDNQEVWYFHWEEVARIITYKRDLSTVDLICLDFFVKSPQSVYSTHDEMQGFQDLCEQMRLAFPSIDKGWWLEVAFPAFAANEQVLYGKSGGSTNRI